MEHYPKLGEIGIVEFNKEVKKRFGDNVKTKSWKNYPNSTFFYKDEEEIAIYTNEKTYGICVNE